MKRGLESCAVGRSAAGWGRCDSVGRYARIFGLVRESGSFVGRVILFVVLKDNLILNDQLKLSIRNIIRKNTTPRHVPEIIIQINGIPRTRSGKIVELAVKDVIHGEEVKSIEALANPESLEYFRDLVELQS